MILMLNMLDNDKKYIKIKKILDSLNYSKMKKKILLTIAKYKL